MIAARLPAAAVGLLPTIGLVVDEVIHAESRIAEEVKPDWVARFGPRYPDLRTAMIDVQTAFRDIERETRNRDDLARVSKALLAMAGMCVKVHLDIQNKISRRYTALPFNDQDPLDDGVAED